MRLFPLFLPFFLGQILALIDFIVAGHAQRSYQIVVSLDASSLASAPVAMSRLDVMRTPTRLAIKAGN